MQAKAIIFQNTVLGFSGCMVHLETITQISAVASVAWSYAFAVCLHRYMNLSLIPQDDP